MTLVEIVREFIKKGYRNYDNPEVLHNICNSYLKALRSGNKRHSCGSLRASIRIIRSRASNMMKDKPFI